MDATCVKVKLGDVILAAQSREMNINDAIRDDLETCTRNIMDTWTKGMLWWKQPYTYDEAHEQAIRCRTDYHFRDCWVHSFRLDELARLRRITEMAVNGQELYLSPEDYKLVFG